MISKMREGAFLGLALVGLLSAAASFAEPLRVDLNASDRGDMRTELWENWLPAEGRRTESFQGLRISLEASIGSQLQLKGDKALLVHGLTLAADAVIAEGSKAPAIEIVIKGLDSGEHSFLGYHSLFEAGGDATSPYRVLVDGKDLGAVTPSLRPGTSDKVATSYVAFSAQSGQPVRIRIEGADGDLVVLNGFAIDDTNPALRATNPSPANFDRHADGDDGKVTLRWEKTKTMTTQNLFLAYGRDPKAVEKRIRAAEKYGEEFIAATQSGSYKVDIVPNDSLMHYMWRVDTIGPDGKTTRSDVWSFRVRHLAFPTAEGYGRFAIGGRGGRVYHVTNLNDSGPGSLREAVEATGPRTVVFDVSGLISLESKLVFREENEFLTVAGQTAPGKGICIRNYTFGGIGGRDTILRFVRLRMGNLAGETMDGMGFASCDNSIIDHCSISWTLDEAFSSRGAKNISFQRNIISEALNIAGHRKYKAGKGHGFAGSISGDIGSFHHSLLAHNAGRNWSLAGAIDQANRHAGRMDIRNMVVYNWQHRTTDGGAREVNFVNNYYKPGPASKILTYLNPDYENLSFGPQQYFVSGNVMEGVAGPEGPTGNFRGMRVRGHQDAPVTVDQPFFESFVTTHSTKDAYTNVLADVGCNVPMLDDHDKRVIEEVRSGKTTFVGSKSGLPGIPDSQDDVGGWEDYPEIHRPENWDTDRDGMPNQWEASKGLDPNDAADGADDPDGDGYTNLEDYLNWLAAGNAF